MIEQSLAGRRIAVPETRELDVFADLLTRRGAEVLRCPLVEILDAPDPQPVLDWLRSFSNGSCDDLILLTGEGLRRLLGCATRHAPELLAPFLEQLAQVRKITRGPKPVKALRELGLKPDIVAAEPTTAGVIAALRGEVMTGRRVGVQLYGTEPNRPLVGFLREKGAEVLTVSPYVYADAAAEEDVRRLIAALATGTLDAIAFTSMAQVQRLYRCAATFALESELRAGLDRSCVAAVGPVVAEALRTQGVRVDLVPEDSYFMKPLTQMLCERLRTPGTEPLGASKEVRRESQT